MNPEPWTVGFPLSSLPTIRTIEGLALRKMVAGDWLFCAKVEQEETKPKIMAGRANLSLSVLRVKWRQRVNSKTRILITREIRVFGQFARCLVCASLF